MFARRLALTISPAGFAAWNKAESERSPCHSFGRTPSRDGLQTAIPPHNERAWFVISDYDAVIEGLEQATGFLNKLRNEDYEVTSHYLEAKSLATVCTLLLSEVVSKPVK